MPVTPKLCSFVSKMAWSTVSKAFLRSQKIVIVYCFELRALVILLIKCVSECECERITGRKQRTLRTDAPCFLSVYPFC